MGPIGTTEIIVIAAILFLLFGASRLPQLAKSIGQSKRAFKEGLEEGEREAEIEEKKKRIASPATPDIPQISEVSDDELQAEMRRRAEAEQS